MQVRRHVVDVVLKNEVPEDKEIAYQLLINQPHIHHTSRATHPVQTAENVWTSTRQDTRYTIVFSRAPTGEVYFDTNMPLDATSIAFKMSLMQRLNDALRPRNAIVGMGFTYLPTPARVTICQIEQIEKIDK